MILVAFAERRAKGLVCAAAAFACTMMVTPSEARAASKEVCVDAHGRGQDLRDRGQLTSAKQMFMTCAQSSCPTLIQGDCARFAEEVERLLPSVSFGARNDSGTDLPGTTVYVDGAMVSTRLDDGKSFELDPGKHTIRFVHEGRETTLDVVLNQGEKGRSILATFVEKHPGASTSAGIAAKPEPKRPTFPLVVAGIGAATMVTGATLFALGTIKMPSNCSMSTHDCAAPPGDNSFNEAHSAAALMNLGTAVGVGGAAVFVGGLVWYFTRPATLPPSQEKGFARVVQPWVGPGSGGVNVAGSF